MAFGKVRGLTALMLSGGLLWAQSAMSEILFTEDFDDLQDFTSTMHDASAGPQQRRFGYTLPEGWDSLYNNTEWSPETGHPDKHASLEILQRNADKARGGTGKSAVMWRESFSKDWNNWASDSQFIKFLDKEYDSLYIEFYIRFSPNWYGRENEGDWSSKLFRVGHFTGTGNEFSPSKGDARPVVLWYYKRDKFGVRNVLNFHGGVTGDSYKFGGQYNTQSSLNFSSHTEGQEVGGDDPMLQDQSGSGYLVDAKGSLTHEQVYGTTDHWTKVAFYVQMNSEIGATDGIFRQWINDVRVVNKENIPWVMETSDGEMVGWNYFAIGGNDFFQPYPNEQRFEDWYSIDDITVATEPVGLSASDNDSEKSSPPLPPESITVID